MNDKYNLIPGACHFLPFFSGHDTHIHFSYIDKYMYCRQEHEVADTRFNFVEARPLGEDSENQLDAMAANDHIGPMQLFGNLPSDQHAHEKLGELLRSYRLIFSTLSELRATLANTEPGSEDHEAAEAELEHCNQEKNDVLAGIESIICEFNRASGYDPKFGTVQSQGC